MASAVDEHLRDKSLPLVLAGTDNRTSALREELSYESVLGDGYSGNTEHYNPAELYQAARGLVKAHSEDSRSAQVKRLEEAAPQFVAVGQDEIMKITELEAGGRIENLYLPMYRNTRDGVQSGDESLIVEIPEDIESVESLVVTVVRNCGKLVPVELGAYDFLDEPRALCRY